MTSPQKCSWLRNLLERQCWPKPSMSCEGQELYFWGSRPGYWSSSVKKGTRVSFVSLWLDYCHCLLLIQFPSGTNCLCHCSQSLIGCLPTVSVLIVSLHVECTSLLGFSPAHWSGTLAPHAFILSSRPNAFIHPLLFWHISFVFNLHLLFISCSLTCHLIIPFSPALLL